jgi:hypothetical protein
LGRLGARLVLQRAVEEEVAAFLNRARYERTAEGKGSRNGTRPKPIQTAEGELSIAMPQVRGTAEPFVSRVIPDTKTVVRTRPLEALIIGSYVRRLSDQDIESLGLEAGLGQVSRTTVSRICRELRGKQLISKVGSSRRYQVPPDGVRTIAALLTPRDQVIKPLLSGTRLLNRGRKPSTWTTLDQHYEQLRLDMQADFQDLGIAA